MMGGRVAEELVFGKDNVTDRASNDFKKATKMVTYMTTQWGLSDELGPFHIDDDTYKLVSEETWQLIDSEKMRILEVFFCFLLLETDYCLGTISGCCKNSISASSRVA